MLQFLELLPNDPLVATGETLILNCSLKDGYNGTLTSGAIYFQWLNVVYNTSHEYVVVLNDRVAQLRMPGMRRSDSSQNMFCYIPDAQYRLGQQVITIAGELMSRGKDAQDLLLTLNMYSQTL